MGGIITDNVGRSSGLIKTASAAGTVLVDCAYASSIPSSHGYVTWAGRGTGGMGGSYGEWGGVLASSSLAITWGSTISFPATGVYQIWILVQTGQSPSYKSIWYVDDGSYGGGSGFAYVSTGLGVGSSNRETMSYQVAYTVDDISNDQLRVYKGNSNDAYAGINNGSNMIISKFE